MGAFLIIMYQYHCRITSFVSMSRQSIVTVDWFSFDTEN